MGSRKGVVRGYSLARMQSEHAGSALSGHRSARPSADLPSYPTPVSKDKYATEGRDGALSRHGAARPSAELPRRPPPVSKREYATGGRDGASSHHRAARRSANLPQVSNRGFNRSRTPACALAREAFWRRLQDRPPPATTRRPPATKPAKTSRYARRSARRRVVR